MLHNYSITTLQARTLLKLVNDIPKSEEIVTCSNVEYYAKCIVEHTLEHYATTFNNSEYELYLAFTESAVMQLAFKRGTLNIFDYVKMYAEHKYNQFHIKRDFGAFGDLIEILTRIVLIGKLPLIKYSHLKVSAINHSDIISKKYGILEIGHNGKTFTEGTCDDFMYGHFESVIYGMFSNEDLEDLLKACMCGDLLYALDFIRDYMVYWRNKYDFLSDLNNLTRGKGITIKSNKVMVQFNIGKYNAFIQAIESGKFTTLKDL